MAKRLILALVLLAGGAVPATAAVTTSISSSTGTIIHTGSVASFEPTGEDMAGMQVTATFGNGFTETKSWVATLPVGSQNGSATGTSSANGWSLSEQGDTFGGAWSLTVNALNSSSSPLTELVLNGVPGNTMFDLKDPIDLTPGMGNLQFTPGSERGWTFEVFNGDANGPFGSFTLNVQASYENAVQVGANPLQSDLFTTLRLTFSGTQGGLPPGYTLIFYQDTDISGEPLIVTDPVPEPSSLAILGGLAIAGVWLRGGRRKRGV